MQSLILDIALERAISRQVLLAAGRHLASSLAEEMSSRHLAWQEVTVQLETEQGIITRSTRLARHQSPTNLHLQVKRLICQIEVSVPVDGLRLVVGELAPAPVVQPNLFDERHREQGFRLRQTLEEVNRKYPLALVQAKLLEDDRREKMFSFYDPLRQGEKTFVQTAAGKV